jgi:hypothetical protein
MLNFSECGSDKHLAAWHLDTNPKPSHPVTNHGGEQSQEQNENSQVPQEEVNAKITEIYGDKPGGRLCSKIYLANIFSKEQLEQKVKAYVVINNKSNCSLAKLELFDFLGKEGGNILPIY